MGRIAGQERERVEAGRVDGIERKAKLGDVLIGGDREIIGSGNSYRQHHHGEEGKTAQRRPGMTDDGCRRA
jgi:hypothetical protein